MCLQCDAWPVAPDIRYQTYSISSRVPPYLSSPLISALFLRPTAKLHHPSLSLSLSLSLLLIESRYKRGSAGGALESRQNSRCGEFSFLFLLDFRHDAVSVPFQLFDFLLLLLLLHHLRDALCGLFPLSLSLFLFNRREFHRLFAKINDRAPHQLQWATRN